MYNIIKGRRDFYILIGGNSYGESFRRNVG